MVNEEELRKIVREEIKDYLSGLLDYINEKHEKKFGKKLF